MEIKYGKAHISEDPNRGYIEYDPYIELSDGKKIHGKHGLINLRAEIADSAYNAGMIKNPAIKEFLKNS